MGYEDICIVHLKEEKQRALNLLLKIYRVINSKQDATRLKLTASVTSFDPKSTYES